MMKTVRIRGASSLKVMMVILAMIHRTSADFSTLIRNSAQSSIERPARAALEPPTVTSLKPPERNTGDDHRTGGHFVQGDHSGSYIPPVVASRSPSSSYPRNYKNRYMHIGTHFSQPPVSPVATATSESQGGHSGAIAGRRSPYDTQRKPIVPPPPTSHLSNSTTVPVYHPSYWNPSTPYIPRDSYGSAGYPPVTRGLPGSRTVYGETKVPEPSFKYGQEHEGGLWSEAEDEQSSIWEHPKKNPGKTHGHHRIKEGRLRIDTFGHQISEDLSHLSDRDSAQISDSRGSLPEEHEDVHIIHQNPTHSHPHFQTHNVREESSPSHPRERVKISSGGFGSPPATYGSHFSSGQTHTASVPSRYPVTYGSEGIHRHRTQGFPRNGEHRVPHTDSVPTPEKSRPLSAYDISQTQNMSSWDEFVKFLQRKGIGVGDIAKKLRDGATREEVITFLNSLDLRASPPGDDKDDQSRDAQDRSKDYADIPTLMTRAEMEDELHRHSSGSRRSRKKNRRGRKKNKGRKNKNNRKRQRKDKQLVSHTTLVTPHGGMTDHTAHEVGHIHNHTSLPSVPSMSSVTHEDLHDNISEKPPTSTVSHIPTKGFPSHTILPEQTTSEPHLGETQIHDFSKSTTILPPSLHKNDFNQPELPATIPFTTAATPTDTTHFTNPHAAILPAFLTTELSSPVKTTPLPSSASSMAGSLTFPPSKPSEVSIIAFTVMKIPKQNAEEETVIEDAMPTKSGKNHHIPRKHHRNFSSQRKDNNPRTYPSLSPKKIEENMVMRTPYIREENKNNYAFPVRGFMIITGIMGALAVFTLVVLISYAIIKCSKQPVVNNYQVSEQKPATQ